MNIAPEIGFLWSENKQTSGTVMAWRRTSNKPQPEQMLTQLSTDVSSNG